MDNTGETWGTSSAIKGNDGISTSPLYIFGGLTYLFFNSEWLKSLKNKQKIGTLIYQAILNITLTTLLFIYGV